MTTHYRVNPMFINGKLPTGPCGTCNECCSYFQPQSCPYDHEADCVDLDMITEALSSSKWVVRSGSNSLLVSISEPDIRSSWYFIKDGYISASAPIGLLEIIADWKPCPNLGTGCESRIYPWHSQCPLCGCYLDD